MLDAYMQEFLDVLLGWDKTKQKEHLKDTIKDIIKVGGSVFPNPTISDTIHIAEDFSINPGPALEKDGENSAELFYNMFIHDSAKINKKITIVLDGTSWYPADFLQYLVDRLADSNGRLNNISRISEEDPSLIWFIDYMTSNSDGKYKDSVNVVKEDKRKPEIGSTYFRISEWSVNRDYAVMWSAYQYDIDSGNYFRTKEDTQAVIDFHIFILVNRESIGDIRDIHLCRRIASNTTHSLQAETYWRLLKRCQEITYQNNDREKFIWFKVS